MVIEKASSLPHRNRPVERSACFFFRVQGHIESIREN
jgi:hypothetical protein